MIPKRRVNVLGPPAKPKRDMKERGNIYGKAVYVPNGARSCTAQRSKIFCTISTHKVALFCRNLSRYLCRILLIFFALLLFLLFLELVRFLLLLK